MNLTAARIQSAKRPRADASSGTSKTLIRSVLVDRLAAGTSGLTIGDVGFVVDVLLAAITTRLAEGGRVEIRGFGSFGTRLRRPRIGRNPRTGQRIPVTAKYVPCFKMGREFRSRLNASFARDVDLSLAVFDSPTADRSQSQRRRTSP